MHARTFVVSAQAGVAKSAVLNETAVQCSSMITAMTLISFKLMIEASIAVQKSVHHATIYATLVAYRADMSGKLSKKRATQQTGLASRKSSNYAH
eukprot:15864-Heterococcus_DN1.PRE.3